MVGVEVGNRVIALVPVHVDHHAVKRADTRHAPTITGVSRHSQEESLIADRFPSSRSISAHGAASIVQTIMTYIERQEGDARPVLGPGSVGIPARLPAHRDVSGGQLNGRSCGEGATG